jgi:membrane-anchored protein YejM (alkaline phosphatase superfamily)
VVAQTGATILTAMHRENYGFEIYGSRRLAHCAARRVAVMIRVFIPRMVELDATLNNNQ